MYNQKPYVVQDKALRALFVRPTLDGAINQTVAFVKDLVDIEVTFLNLQGGKIQPVSVITYGGHIANDNRPATLVGIDKTRTANDDGRPDAGGHDEGAAA